MKNAAAISAAILALASSSARSQNPEIDRLPGKVLGKRLTLIVEFIEIGQKDWNAWVANPENSISGPTLRNHLQKFIKSGKATLIHTAIASGLPEFEIESVSAHEHIYPTEFEPPDVSLVGTKKTRTQGASFEARDNGASIEAEIERPSIWLPDPSEPATARESHRISLTTNLVDRIRDVPVGGDDKETLAPLFHNLEHRGWIQCSSGETMLFSSHRPHQASVKSRKNPVILTFVRLDVHDLSKGGR